MTREWVRPRRWLVAPIFWLFGSTFTHVSIATLMLMGHGAAAASGGEAGLRGGGDTNIDISVAGSDGNEIAPPAPVDPEPPPPVAPPPKEPQLAPRVAPRDPDSLVSPPPAETAPPRAIGNAAETNGGRAAGGEAGGAPVRLGRGAGDTPKGDTIEGQRALLPGAVTCKDPVEGVWESLKYNPISSAWVRFTLLVHRAGGDLTGAIHSHTWYGNALDSTPPACSPRGFEMSVSMKAHGKVDQATRIRFGASAYSIVALQCPAANTDYAPDNFSGTIDTGRQEFQSVNNDGAADIDAPYVFRRTGCFED